MSFSGSRVSGAFRGFRVLGPLGFLGFWFLFLGVLGLLRGFSGGSLGFLAFLGVRVDQPGRLLRLARHWGQRVRCLGAKGATLVRDLTRNP